MRDREGEVAVVIATVRGALPWRRVFFPPARMDDAIRGFVVRFPDGTCARWNFLEGGVDAIWIVGERPDYCDMIGDSVEVTRAVTMSM
jgi:hypothetical protein